MKYFFAIYIYIYYKTFSATEIHQKDNGYVIKYENESEVLG